MIWLLLTLYLLGAFMAFEKAMWYFGFRDSRLWLVTFGWPVSALLLACVMVAELIRDAIRAYHEKERKSF